MVSVLPTTAASRVLVASLLALITLAGCGDLEQAAAAGSSRDDLASDLADQLGGSASLTYTATYQLAGGKTATISQAQEPTRSAYVYPGGKVIVTADAITRCEPRAKKLTCTMTAPTSPAPAAVFVASTRIIFLLSATVTILMPLSVLFRPSSGITLRTATA